VFFIGDEGESAQARSPCKLLFQLFFSLFCLHLVFSLGKDNGAGAVTPRITHHITHMIHLIDTFNRRLISRHRSVDAAVRAEKKHLRQVRKANGQSAYLTYSIFDSEGRDIREAVETARINAHFTR